MSAGDMRDWRRTEQVWLVNGTEIPVPPEFRTEGDTPSLLPDGVATLEKSTWDRTSIEQTIARITKELSREPGSVTIARNSSGGMMFEGIGLTGRSVNLPWAAAPVIRALEEKIPIVTLPIGEVQPQITVLDRELQQLGIREIVTIGESDYAGSPPNRRHNIGVGLRRFNGVLIPQGATFSFNDILGPVGERQGYRKELTILGERTLPDYGGGLCQVSTTAYRGAWEYGFPIAARRNHSFAVNYYSPKGTDATIYPPAADMRFVNNSSGALLIQTFAENGKAYFLFYGTRDDRETELIGPYTWDPVPPPPPRTEFTTEIPPGTTRKVGDPVPGLKAFWARIIRSGEGEMIEGFSSIYQARSLFTQIGIANMEDIPAPDWVDVDPGS